MYIYIYIFCLVLFLLYDVYKFKGFNIYINYCRNYDNNKNYMFMIGKVLFKDININNGIFEFICNYASFNNNWNSKNCILINFFNQNEKETGYYYYPRGMYLYGNIAKYENINQDFLMKYLTNNIINRIIQKYEDKHIKDLHILGKE